MAEPLQATDSGLWGLIMIALGESGLQETMPQGELKGHKATPKWGCKR